MNSYIKLTKGNWTCVHIWDIRHSVKEYEELGFEVMIIKISKDGQRD